MDLESGRTSGLTDDDMLRAKNCRRLIQWKVILPPMWSCGETDSSESNLGWNQMRESQSPEHNRRHSKSERSDSAPGQGQKYSEIGDYSHPTSGIPNLWKKRPIRSSVLVKVRCNISFTEEIRPVDPVKQWIFMYVAVGWFDCDLYVIQIYVSALVSGCR